MFDLSMFDLSITMHEVCHLTKLLRGRKVIGLRGYRLRSVELMGRIRVVMWTLATVGCHSLSMFATSQLWRRASLAFKPMQAESFRSKRKSIPGSNAASKNGSYQGIALELAEKVLRNRVSNERCTAKADKK